MTTILEAVRAESLRMTVREAVKRVTAFCCERDMQDAMRGGYCPTLRTVTEPMGVEQGRDNHAVRVVRAWVLDGGFSYFDGRRVVQRWATFVELDGRPIFTADEVQRYEFEDEDSARQWAEYAKAECNVLRAWCEPVKQ